MGILDDLGDRSQWSADQGLKVAGLGVKLTARDACVVGGKRLRRRIGEASVDEG